MKKVFAIICLFLCFALHIGAQNPSLKSIQVSKSDSALNGTRIGISMPTKNLERWEKDGASLKRQLEKLGYEIDLSYAANDIPTQIYQIENMIRENCKVIVIAPIDGYALSYVLESAKEKGIKIVSYDRLIMESDAVSYYITFDRYKIGVVQGEFIVDKFKLKNRSSKKPIYMEFFTGDLRDRNINFYFGGAMDVLGPYLKSGVVVCRSNQTSKAQCATFDWSTEEAQERMENLIVANGYGPKNRRLDAVCCSNDSTALGVTNALLALGYEPKNFPVITGQDCDIINIRNIIKGTQSMSVFMDTRTLVSKTVEMVDSIMKDKEPLINDTKTYNNGTGFMQSYLCEPSVVTKNNYKSLLIEPGYYTEATLMR